MHTTGILLFLFIPLVLFLFLRFPYGILPSFLVAILIMVAHRFVARPYFLNNLNHRCFWCGRTGAVRKPVQIQSGVLLELQLCENHCMDRGRRFFDFCSRFGWPIRAGIFIPLLWYVATMVFVGFHLISFPLDWNRFIFQFTIAITVVSVALGFRLGRDVHPTRFPFPIHNLFLLGARNVLVIFFLVGAWWIFIGIQFLYSTVLSGM